MSNIPKIEPIKVQEFEVKQSKYDMVGKLPTRARLLFVHPVEEEKQCYSVI